MRGGRKSSSPQETGWDSKLAVPNAALARTVETVRAGISDGRSHKINTLCLDNVFHDNVPPNLFAL